MAATDYDFTTSRNQVIRTAFEIIGAIGPGDTLSGERQVQGQNLLNLIVKSWQAKHCFLWTEVSGTKAITAATYYYDLSTDPPLFALERAFLRISNDDKPLEVISWASYNQIPNKADTGDPTVVCVNPASGQAYFWPVPNANRTVFWFGLAKLKDWDTAAGHGDFPVQFVDALVYDLAGHLSDRYLLPLGERQLLKGEAIRLFREAINSDHDQEENTYVRSAFAYGPRNSR